MEEVVTITSALLRGYVGMQMRVENKGEGGYLRVGLVKEVSIRKVEGQDTIVVKFSCRIHHVPSPKNETNGTWQRDPEMVYTIPLGVCEAFLEKNGRLVVGTDFVGDRITFYPKIDVGNIKWMEV
jgi:hypothetical protein